MHLLPSLLQAVLGRVGRTTESSRYGCRVTMIFLLRSMICTWPTPSRVCLMATNANASGHFKVRQCIMPCGIPRSLIVFLANKTPSQTCGLFLETAEPVKENSCAVAVKKNTHLPFWETNGKVGELIGICGMTGLGEKTSGGNWTCYR